jgi:peroxiredoxin
VGVPAQAPTIDTSKIGPQVGQKVPGFSGTDHLGKTHTLTASLGPNGAMLVFYRSADW